MRTFLQRAAVLLLVLSALVPGPARAVLEIDITEGVVEPLPIAISDFYGASLEAQDFGRRIAQVVEADLERSGLFRPIDRRAFIQSPEELQGLPRFADWRQINAQALVTGATEVLPNDQIGVEFRLWDVFAGSQMRGLRLETSAENWRRIGHKVADAIYERLTGGRGYLVTQIVYISESGPPIDRVKRIAIMDQDGANHRFLSDGAALVLTPRFDPLVNRIAYMAYIGRTPQVYVRDLLTGRESRVGAFTEMTFAPHFAPSGRTIALSLAESGNSDIYLIDLVSGAERRLTTHPSIDTSPSFSPDGERIVFNSDRAGSPQLYVMDVNGSNVTRISFGEGHYGSPAWSPRGDLIAFTKIVGGFFHIGVIRPDGSDERLLTRSALDESPSWAPNGRVILFSRKDPASGRTRLFSIDVTGYNEREVPTPQDATDPDWSNLLS